jgi:DNA repair exonuclease SbcCD ATPase subunit
LQEEARQLRENLEHEKEAVIKLQTQLKEAIAADNTKFEEQLDQKIATGIELGLEQKTQRTNEELSKLQPETEQLKLDVSKLRQQIVEIIRDHQNSLDFKLGEHEKQITTIAEKLENQMNLNQKLEELENEIIAITENLQNQTSQRLAELKKEITEITEEQHNETYKKLWELEKALTTVSEGVQNGNDGMEQLIAEGFETEKTKLKQEIKAFAQEMTSALKKETDRALDTITRNVVNLSQTRTNRGRSNSEPPSPLKETGAHPSLGANKMDEAKARAFSEEVNQVRLFPSYAIYETAITPKKKARLDKLKQDLTIKPFSPKELQKNFGKLMDGTIHDESEEEAEQPNISDNLLKMAGYGTPVAEKVRKVVDDELKIDC